jgi:hypothetical protein
MFDFRNIPYIELFELWLTNAHQAGDVLKIEKKDSSFTTIMIKEENRF